METQHMAQEGAVWQAQSRKNYGGQFAVKGSNQSCYTRKQMKSLYPKGGFERVGEYAAGSRQKQDGNLHLGGKLVPLYGYGAHSRLLYSEKCFVAVGEDRYAVLLKRVALPRALIMALCAAVIAVGIIFGPGLFAGSTQTIGDEDTTLAEGQVPDLEEGAVDWAGVQPRDTGGVTQGIAIPGYKSITVDANQTDVKVNFQNPEGNPCYFVISLVLDDDTVLYQSKMVEPGKGLYDITLTQPLERGQYSAMVKYETFSLGDLIPMNGAEVRITLIAD